MENLIEITAFSNVNDAYVLRTLLESEGIKCVLHDENSSVITNKMTTAGAVKVMIPSNDFNKATELMTHHGYDVNGLEDENMRKERPDHLQKSPPKTRMLIWAILILGVILFYFLYKSYSIGN